MRGPLPDLVGDLFSRWFRVPCSFLLILPVVLPGHLTLFPADTAVFLVQTGDIGPVSSFHPTSRSHETVDYRL
jgi:hypothetical protein